MNRKHTALLSLTLALWGFSEPLALAATAKSNKAEPKTVEPENTTTLNDALKSTLEQTYNNSTELLAAREGFKKDAEKIVEALAGWKPSINAQASQSWSQQRTSGRGTGWKPGDPTARQRNVGVELKQNLFKSGGTFFTYEATKNNILAKAGQLNAKEAEILVKSINALADCLLKEIEISIYEKTATSYRQILNASENKLKFGEETQTNVEQARAQLAKNEADLLIAKAKLIELDQAYINLTGKPRTFHAPSDLNKFADSNLMFSKDVQELLVSLPPKALEYAKKHNPNLKASQFGEIAASNGVKQAYAQLGPSVDLTGNVGAAKILNSTTPSGYMNDKSVSLSVSIPLYNGGTQLSSIRAARAGEHESKIGTRNLENTIRQNVLYLYEQVKSLKESIELHRRAVKANGLSMSGMQQEISVGSKSVLDIIEIQNRYLQSQLNLAKAASQYWLTVYQYLSVLGAVNVKKLGLKVDYFDPLAHYKSIKWFF